MGEKYRSIKVKDSTLRRLRENAIEAYREDNPDDTRHVSVDFIINRMITYYIKKGWVWSYKNEKEKR